MFYESHQAQWVSGERTLSTLLHEPQAHLPVLGSAQGRNSLHPMLMPAAAAAEGGLPAAAPNKLPPAQPGLVQGQPLTASVNGAMTGREEHPDMRMTPADRHDSFSSAVSDRDMALRVVTGSHDSQGAPAPRDPVHPLAQPVVQQQLETLETRHIVWQGQVWPGQHMDWEIDEDGARSNGDGEDEAPRWRTQLHLQLPGLGGVTAKILMDGQGVRVDFAADRDKTASLMKNDIATLARSMEEAGLKVSALQVNQDETV